MAEVKKVVLAYSGGLDTSIIIPWLKENYNNPEIIAVSADVGQGSELDGLEEKAIKTGASKLYIEDLTDEMVDDVIIPSMMMGAKYEDYLLGTAFARPVIAKRLVEIAKKEGADAVCHGCTGKGNDQVRFELAIKRFAPELKIIAPWREWSIKGRDEEIDYAEAHNVPLKISRETNYSKDKNLWHLSHEGLDLEDPANEPKYDEPGFLEMGVSPAVADTVGFCKIMQKAAGMHFRDVDLKAFSPGHAGHSRGDACHERAVGADIVQHVIFVPQVVAFLFAGDEGLPVGKKQLRRGREGGEDTGGFLAFPRKGGSDVLHGEVNAILRPHWQGTEAAAGCSPLLDL